MRKSKISLLIFFIACNFTSFSQKKTSSALSSGDIYKFSVENTGLYKLNYDLLKGIEDLNIDNLDPRLFNIYNSGGGVVPQVLTDERIDDVERIPILVSGENDGSFDQGDYILVYLEGADKFHINSNEIRFDKNVYDTKNYFYLKVNDNAPKRVDKKASLGSAEFISPSTEVVIRHEQERLNLLGNFGGTQGSGKQWFGESFANEPIQSFDSFFNIPNLVSNATGNIEVNFAARAPQTTSFELNIDGQVFSKNISSTAIGNIEAIYAHIRNINETIQLNSGNPSITISFDKRGQSSEAWLDYIQLTTRKNIVYSGEPLFIFDRASSNYSSFGFEINGNATIWDISDITEIQEIEKSNSSFLYESTGDVKTFVAFESNDVRGVPTYVKKVVNQNLHAITEADLAIVYYKEFEEAAEKLASHRISHDDMTVVTADVEEIYNEFGGHNDPSAIRDFAKMLYDRDPNFKYLLLLGDASYDFRGLNTELEYQNFVPTYETNQSLHPVEAFPSDDFYALLTGSEGGDSMNGALDIGVGRIPAKTNDEALNVVDKIINYDTNPAALGDWRMRLGFTADDEDSNIHIRQADGIARLTDTNHAELNQQKVYFDAFNQEATPGGARYPDAKEALNANLFNGQLVLNYLGHGGPKGWAQERVFQNSDILNLKNKDRLPIFITATCSFTGFDEPTFISAGEHSLLNPSGGAIALFSTVRAVYSSQNERITREVFKTIFTRQEGKALRFGDVMRMSQNANSSDTISSNTRKFMLFGDPSQRLALPEYNISITKINDQEIIEGQTDTLGALGKMKLSGQVEDFDGSMINDFNGKVFITVFDKESDLKTLDNDGEDEVFDFKLRKNILYKGSATVNNGLFDIEFIIPKDINFEFGQGKISLYATDEVSKDAGGHYDKVIIGGTSEGNIVDNEGPEINIFFDDRAFVFGGQTGKNPLLILDLSDENGINLSSTSIGHDISAVFDEDDSKSLILNEFFQPTLDELGSGTVEYQLSDLTPGLHSINVKAWDILNNASEKRSEFLVVENVEGFINNVYNYPNPFSTNTNFTFEHDLTNSNLDILVNVYTVSGKLVKTIQTQRFASGSRVNDVAWNGNDDFEGNLAKGIYFYKIKITSPELNLSRESDFQKLVILN